MSVEQVWPPPLLAGGVVLAELPPPPPQAANRAPATSAKAKGKGRAIVEVNMVWAPGVECDAVAAPARGCPGWRRRFKREARRPAIQKATLAPRIHAGRRPRASRSLRA